MPVEIPWGGDAKFESVLGLRRRLLEEDRDRERLVLPRWRARRRGVGERDREVESDRVDDLPRPSSLSRFELVSIVCLSRFLPRERDLDVEYDLEVV